MQTERNGVFCTWYFSRINAKYLNAICPLLNKVIQAVGGKKNWIGVRNCLGDYGGKNVITTVLS